MSTERSGPEDSSVILSFDVWLPAVLSASLRCCCTVVVATAVETTANLPSGVVGARQSVHAYSTHLGPVSCRAGTAARGGRGNGGRGGTEELGRCPVRLLSHLFFTSRGADAMECIVQTGPNRLTVHPPTPDHTCASLPRRRQLISRPSVVIWTL